MRKTPYNNHTHKFYLAETECWRIFAIILISDLFDMGLWKPGIERSKNLNHGVRLGEDRTYAIEEFFALQSGVVSYDIVDKTEWTVNVEGSIHLDQSDLDEGELFFKIGRLSGNLYFHGEYFKQSVVPDELGGSIIIVDDNEGKHYANENGNDEEDTFGMGLLTKKSREQVVKLLETALTESLANGYDIDVQEILTRLSEDWKNRDKYQLRVVIKEIEYGSAHNKRKSDKLECDFYISPSEKPLKLLAIEKAVYLLFILHENGLKLNMKKNHVELLRKIYNKLEDTVQDTENGIMNKEFLLVDTTLNGYRSHIRKEIQKRISNSKIVDEFAIEGEREKSFTVQRATEEMRAEIREKFGLD